MVVIFSMRKVNLKSVDLNLLVILDVLLEERQVTRAAERLHMSQPAVSRALQRLRTMFADPLLVRSTAGFQLSARAAELQSELKTLLQGIAGLIAPPDFSPHMAQSRVTLVGPGLDLVLPVPEFLATVYAQAPGLRLELDSQPGDHFQALMQGQVDFLLTGIEPKAGQDQLYRTVFSKTPLVLVMGAHHPLAAKEITIDNYLASSHGFVSLTGRGAALTDIWLKTQGRQRHTGLRLTSFYSIAAICEQTELIFRLPLNHIKPLLTGRNVVLKALPEALQSEPLSHYLYWHKRDHQDPLHRWMREQILRFSQLDERV